MAKTERANLSVLVPQGFLPCHQYFKELLTKSSKSLGTKYFLALIDYNGSAVKSHLPKKLVGLF